MGGLRRASRLWMVLPIVGPLVIVAAAWTADRFLPPDLTMLDRLSTVVTDRDGVTLRAFRTADGQWRLPVEPAAVSPNYLAILLAIEDKRFWSHPGVDPLALGRAFGQLVARGHVVSGGSTLTMQVARMLEPRPRRWRAKLIEMARALQLEHRLGKAGVLRAYFTLAPMGGNLQGVRAGSLAWFGKEPGQLSDAEAALLVALPQSPTLLRPDGAPVAASLARNRILGRGWRAGVLAGDAVAAAQATPIPTVRQPLPALAPHLAERLAARPDTPRVVTTTLEAGMQRGVERVLRQQIDRLARPVNLAALVADWRTGAILARAGSGDYFDGRRTGMVDMSRAVRSPGSTLKPFIYGMAFDALLAHPASLVRDQPTRFDDYAPHNFDGGYNGDVTIRDALKASLNLPAVLTLQRLGPVTFTEAFRTAGLPLVFDDRTTAPGLPVALGGVGATLDTLVAAYAALANGGTVVPLTEISGQGADAASTRLLGRAGADAVANILAEMPAPGEAGRRTGIAYKTGTSYRFRDGWAVGFDGSRVAGVWMGRADGGTCTGCVGIAAADILFRLFDLLPADPLPRRVLDPVLAGPPPPTLVRLRAPTGEGADEGPRIVFPPTQSRLLVDPPGEGSSPTGIKLTGEGGQKPYRWLVDGMPIESRAYARDAAWHPAGQGFSTVTLIDAYGRSTEAKVRVVTRGAM